MLLHRFPRHHLWGYGLAYLGDIYAATSGVPHEVVRAAQTARLHERLDTETLCTATIFDARAHTYTAVTHPHLPEYELPTLVTNTRETTDTTDAWIELFDQNSAAAQAWAAALALDPDGNHADIARLTHPEAATTRYR
ncbi:hypothetical protein [Nocardia australiensis]|uniref:hypothetical protein n=1 Tax=Nocardia australiensis TaxID=2887191 RepID=UPI001D138A00|nr:hypothetical protein [Nocardia australiensis]